MMKRRAQAGFAAVEIVIIVVVIAVIGGAGYYVWHQHGHGKQPVAATTATTQTQSKSQSTSASTPSAPQVNNAADLKDAAQALDQTDISASSSDSDQLSSQASGF